MISTLSVMAVIGGLIFIHELGHFLVARLFGMGVSAFSLGFGPRVFGIRTQKTDYRLSALPLGGFVSLVGQSADEEIPEGFTEDELFYKRPAWQRMLVVMAGPLANIALACALATGLLFAQGKTEILPVVGGVQPSSPAAEAGLTGGDKVITVDGRPVHVWSELVEAVGESEGKSITLGIEREGRTMDVSLTPRISSIKNIFGDEVKRPMIGLVAKGETKVVPLNLFQALTAGLRSTWDMVELTATGLWKVVTRSVPLDSLGGPVMIAQMVSDQAKVGLSNVIGLAAVISVNLGLLNLLPIPVLDGGHILFYALETIRGRPVSMRMQIVTTQIGLALLLCLMGLAIYNDLARLFS